MLLFMVSRSRGWGRSYNGGMSIRALSEADLRWVVCPVCHGSLRLDADEVVCVACLRRYPIVDGIPVLIEARAR